MDRNANIVDRGPDKSIGIDKEVGDVPNLGALVHEKLDTNIAPGVMWQRASRSRWAVEWGTGESMEMGIWWPRGVGQCRWVVVTQNRCTHVQKIEMSIKLDEK